MIVIITSFSALCWGEGLLEEHMVTGGLGGVGDGFPAERCILIDHQGICTEQVEVCSVQVYTK